VDLLKIKFYGRTDFAEAMGSGSGTTGMQKVLEWMATLVQHCRYRLDHLHHAARVIDQTLTSLSQHRQHADKIVVQYKVAVQLSLPFSDIDVKDPYNLLLFLLLNGKPLFPLIEAFITHYQLNYAKVTASSLPLLVSLLDLAHTHTLMDVHRWQCTSRIRTSRPCRARPEAGAAWAVSARIRHRR
jgi:hypothetical protein